MSSRGRMTMRAAVQRYVSVEDEYGQPGPPTWNPHIAALPCWLYSTAEREVMGEKTAVVEDLKLLVPRGTDVTEKDRINGVTDRLGAVISPGVHVIESVQRRKRHVELALRRIAA